MGILNKLKQIFTADPAPSSPPASQRDVSVAVADYQRMINKIDLARARRVDDELDIEFWNEVDKEAQHRWLNDPEFREAFIRQMLAEAQAEIEIYVAEESLYIPRGEEVPALDDSFWENARNHLIELEAKLRSPDFDIIKGGNDLVREAPEVRWNLVNEFRAAEGKQAVAARHEQEKRKIISEIEAAGAAMPQQDDRNKQAVSAPKFR